MVRDEAGLLVGYVYVDIDQSERDIGGYVNDAKAAVSKALASGQLQPAAGLLPQVDRAIRTARGDGRADEDRRPVTLMIIIVLLFLHFPPELHGTLDRVALRPFAARGSVWLIWALNFRISPRFGSGSSRLLDSPRRRDCHDCLHRHAICGASKPERCATSRHHLGAHEVRSCACVQSS